MPKMKVNTLSKIFNLYEKAAPRKKWPLLLTLIALLAAASGRVNGSAFNFSKESVINEHNNFGSQDEFVYPDKDPYEDTGYGLGGMKLKFELLDEMNNAFFMHNNKKINMIQFPANNPIQDRCFVYEIDMSNDVLEPIGSFQRIKDKEDRHFIKAFEKSAIKYVNEIDFPSNHNYYVHMSNTAIERGKGKSTKKGLDRGGAHGPSVLGPSPPWDSTVLMPTPVPGAPRGPPMGRPMGSSMGLPMGSSMGLPMGSSLGPSMAPPMGPPMGPGGKYPMGGASGVPMGHGGRMSMGGTSGSPMGSSSRMPMPANNSAKAEPWMQAPTTTKTPQSFVETKTTEKTAEPTTDSVDVNAGESITEEAVEPMDVDSGDNATEEAIEPLDEDAGESVTEEELEPMVEDAGESLTEEEIESMDMDGGENATEETAEKVSDKTDPNAIDEASESTSNEVVENVELAEAENAGGAAVESAEEATAERAEAAATEAIASTTEAANAEAQTGEGSNTENAADQSDKTAEEQASIDSEEEAIAGTSTMETSDFLNRQELSNNVFERYSQYYDEMKAFNDSFIFAAVIDGHGGEVIADIVKRWLGFYVKKQLMEKLRNNDHQILTPSDIVASLEEAHIQLDNDILKKAKEYFFKGNVKYTRNGSCSISVLMDKNYYYVSNVGDSKGLLIKKIPLLG